MFAGVYMIMVFDPQILFNDGFYDLMDVRIPPGTLLKPLKPAALSCRTHALGRIFDMLGGLLGQGNPAFMCAAGFSDSPHFMYSGYDNDGEWYQLYQIGFGGIPGPTVRRRARRAFAVAVVHERAERIPRELFPAAHRHLRDDRGFRRRRRKSAAATASASATGSSSRARSRSTTTAGSPIPGASTADCRARSRKLLVRADGSEQLLPSKCDRIKVEAGDLLYFDTWGGGGWGDPLERDPAKVAFDVDAGLVSAEGARRYGVVLKNGRVDAKATAELRAQMAAARGPVPLFDRGFKDIAELKARCKAETGLEAPAAPQFQSRVRKAAAARRA